MRRDVVSSFTLHLFGHFRIFRIPELLVVLHLLLQAFEARRVSSQVLALVLDLCRTMFIHETRRLSDGHVDGVTAVWHRVDAIDAKLKFGKGWKSR